MRVALVSPYSWTYPGGVTRHIEALAGELAAGGHDVRVLAPFDRDTRATALLHRGARPQVRERPEWLVPLGGTIGWPSNGAVSNLAGTPSAVSTLRRELRAARYDVVHLHEPVAPVVGWDALTSADAPLVGTFHCYSRARPAAPDRDAARRPPQAQPAARCGSRSPRPRRGPAGASTAATTGSSPTASTLPAGGVPAPRRRRPGEPLRIVFVGQAVERKGLPVLLRAFEALRDHVPAELTIVGRHAATRSRRCWSTRAGVTALGRVDDDAEHAALEDADVLCAPSLGGESFGMVLTEAFAAGHAGRRLRHRRLPRRRRATASTACSCRAATRTALAETLRDLALEPARTARLGAAARAQRRALRLAAGRRAGGRGLRGRARGARARGRRRARRRARSARCPPTGARARARAGCPRSSRRRRRGRRRLRRRARRAVLARVVAGAGVGALLALERIGMRPIAPRAGRLAARRGCSSGSALMCASMVAARRRLARDPARRAARRAAAAASTRCRARRSAC